MLEKQKDIDAVVVATPDHTHAVVAMAAMQLGKHVYVQKPLTRTISEARALTEAARKYKVVTQMGNQGHSEEGLRLMQEWLEGRRDRRGARGALLDQPADLAAGHAAADRGAWPVPDGLDWELWIGPAPMRPFHKTYHPFGWRAWQDFGTGAMGDMACHVMDASFTILKLGAPHSVIASLSYNFLPPAPGQRGFGQRVEYNDSYPPSSIDPPDVPGARQHAAGEAALVRRRPAARAARRSRAGPEAARVGHDLRRRQGRRCGARPTRRARASFRSRRCRRSSAPPKTLPRVPDGRDGHERNWLDAIRQKGQAVSNFDYAGPFTETVLLGNVALRFPSQRLLWDSASMKVTNMPDADQYVQHNYRPGWTLTT